MSDGGKEFAVIDLVTKADLRDAMDLMTLKLTLRLGVHANRRIRHRLDGPADAPLSIYWANASRTKIPAP